MAEGKRIRKVLKDIGVGISTAKEFLESNGYSDINPNTRLDDKAYGLLLGEFAADQKLKEEAEAKAEVLQKRNDERLAAAEEKIAPPPTPPTSEPEPTPEPKPESTVIKATVKKAVGPKLVGKVNLEDLDPVAKKKKAVAEKARKEAEEAESAKKAVEAKVEKATALIKTKAVEAATAKKDAATAKKEAAAAKKEAEEAKKDGEVIRAKVDKLAGAKVLGKKHVTTAA